MVMEGEKISMYSLWGKSILWHSLSNSNQWQPYSPPANIDVRYWLCTVGWLVFYKKILKILCPKWFLLFYNYTGKSYILIVRKILIEYRIKIHIKWSGYKLLINLAVISFLPHCSLCFPFQASHPGRKRQTF